MTTNQTSAADPCGLILSEFVSQKEHVYLTLKDRVRPGPRTKAITPGMDLPSTDTGYWRADAHSCALFVPAPEGWGDNWHTSWDGIVSDCYPEPASRKIAIRMCHNDKMLFRMRRSGERLWRPLIKKKLRTMKVPVDYFSPGN